VRHRQEVGGDLVQDDLPIEAGGEVEKHVESSRADPGGPTGSEWRPGTVPWSGTPMKAGGRRGGHLVARPPARGRRGPLPRAEIALSPQATEQGIGAARKARTSARARSISSAGQAVDHLRALAGGGIATIAAMVSGSRAGARRRLSPCRKSGLKTSGSRRPRARSRTRWRRTGPREDAEGTRNSIGGRAATRVNARWKTRSIATATSDRIASSKSSP